MRIGNFQISVDGEGRLLSLSHPDDPYAMNWVEGEKPWGTVVVPQWPDTYDSWGVPAKPYRLDVRVERELTPTGRLRERYVFENHSDFEIVTLRGEVGIYATFNDSYEPALISERQRCSAHIWCGGDVGYVMALRMGGEPPHLGLALTQGALQGYSIERDVTHGSNDRGDIILHPAPMRIVPGGRKIVEWELFWFDSREEFQHVMRGYPRFIEITAEQFIVFEGEEIRLRSNAQPALLEMPSHGQRGERRITFQNDFARTFADILVQPPFEELLEKRVRFIAEKQQCADEASALYGAYLIYDNEEQRQYYSHIHDHNAARERVGIGALIARYLRARPDASLRQSLELYARYVLRELFDDETGTVYNDYGRCNDWHRIYNYGWMIQFFSEMYFLQDDAIWLQRAVKALKRFYASGGDQFYPIGLSITELSAALRGVDMEEERADILRCFARHAENLLADGTDYPAQEVRYEQSIVMPAATLMLQAYELNGNERYLKSAEEHLRLLDLFHGQQPDFHLNEVAIRHWDGYWFGKRRLLGDTFPHYWSALSGDVFANYARLTGDKRCAQRAERLLRGPLSMFRADGSASCAMIYPMSVNGRPAHVYDPWANDQDWAMYYYLKWHDGLGPSMR